MCKHTMSPNGDYVNFEHRGPQLLHTRPMCAWPPASTPSPPPQRHSWPQSRRIRSRPPAPR